MPVLDANALKTDPEGAAFLLSVLRPRDPAKASLEKALAASRRAMPESKPPERRLRILSAV
ncbi:hypothetical protein [Microvirga puerhi]|uniref:Uncharacterized protein n=1 Tax=Microvirga puerhi TaxID=2876078 RepID=A0ABS7VQG4_9HYPH|nr:hypothetical protein [Microvirga puerhi]MBZ6077794.1 hypothetical protein [Microvirga puerhi]